MRFEAHVNQTLFFLIKFDKCNLWHGGNPNKHTSLWFDQGNLDLPGFSVWSWKINISLVPQGFLDREWEIIWFMSWLT